MNAKKTLKERKAETDAKIITSAIQCFGQKGYTNTSLIDIAKGAGVSSGLLPQRFGTKENLFHIAFLEVMNNYFENLGENETAKECFIAIIDRIKEMNIANKDHFYFCCMLYNSTDLPKDHMKEHIDHMRQHHDYRILEKAQADGLIPIGSIDGLISAFNANALNHISLCKKYNLEIPDYNFFFKSIHFIDNEPPKTENRSVFARLPDDAWNFNSMYNLAKPFIGIIYADFKSGEFSPLKMLPIFEELLLSYTKIDDAVAVFLKYGVSASSYEEMKTFLDWRHIRAALNLNNPISIEYYGAIQKWKRCKASWITVKWDENGHVSSALLTFKNI